jgi:hypothetical protein
LACRAARSGLPPEPAAPAHSDARDRRSRAQRPQERTRVSASIISQASRAASAANTSTGNTAHRPSAKPIRRPIRLSNGNPPINGPPRSCRSVNLSYCPSVSGERCVNYRQTMADGRRAPKREAHHSAARAAPLRASAICRYSRSGWCRAGRNARRPAWRARPCVPEMPR